MNYDFKKHKERFLSTFVIDNKKLKKSYSIFFLMDLNKEEILKKEKKIKKEIKENYLEESFMNLKIIHDYIFKPNRMLIFGNNIHKIEEVNFTMCFLAKTFIYII